MYVLQATVDPTNPSNLRTSVADLAEIVTHIVNESLAFHDFVLISMA